MDRYRINRTLRATQYLFSTVRIKTEYEDGEWGSGTAFFFDLKGEPGRACLVTNQHVLEDAKRLSIRFHVTPDQDQSNFTVHDEYTLLQEDPTSKWSRHPDGSTDLSAIRIDSLKRSARGALDELFYLPIHAGHVPSESEERRYPAILEVAMIGYPSGLADDANNLPIIRRGTTASHIGIDFDGLPDIAVDIACFPGSSGSPIAIYDPPFLPTSTTRFLGVLYQGATLLAGGGATRTKIPARLAGASGYEAMINLGFAIKARKVRELAESLL